MDSKRLRVRVLASAEVGCVKKELGVKAEEEHGSGPGADARDIKDEEVDISTRSTGGQDTEHIDHPADELPDSPRQHVSAIQEAQL